MSEAVIVALITGAVSLIGTIVTVLLANQKTLAAMDKKSDVSDEKIQGEMNVLKADIRTLSSRVEAHNRMIERTYKLERRADVHEEQIKVANHRIADLERKGESE